MERLIKETRLKDIVIARDVLKIITSDEANRAFLQVATTSKPEQPSI